MGRRDTLQSRLLRFLIPEKIPWFAARLYDQIAHNAIETYYRQMAERITAQIKEGAVLDIGTGPGYLPIEIAKRAPGLSVVGVDASKALVRIAQLNAEREGVSDRVQFLKSDGNKLDFADESFDLVISTGSLHAWKNPVVVIDECFRVLKTGREAWIFDPAYIMTPETRKSLEKGLTAMDKVALRWGSITSKLTPSYSVKEMEAILRRTKFQKGRVSGGKWLTVKLKKAQSGERSSSGT